MIPRVEIKAVELLKAGHVMTKYELASAAFCDPRTAARTLAKLHSSTELIRVAKWVPIYRRKIPAYAIGDGKDANKPKAISDKNRKRIFREDNPESLVDQALKKRIARFNAKGKL